MNIEANGSQFSPENLVPRLGEILVKEKLLQPESLAYALSKQSKLTAEGKSMLLGQVIVEEGLIEQETIDGVITRQIFQLQAALERSNRDLERRVKQRTSELQVALEKLGELNQLKANFMSNVSHELRMPMQLLLGYLDLMANGSIGELTGEQNNAVGTMLGACERLRNLIEDLLTFSKLTRSDLPVNLDPVSLEARVMEAVEKVTPAAYAKEIELRTHLVSGVPPVSADGDQIRWVVGQLLDNAVKFTPRGGRVRVKTIPHNKSVTVSVRDNGIGIPSDRLTDIFKPFHQVDGSITRKHDGVGLGLALAQSILQAHGTSIRVKSLVGRGSRFSFSLLYS